MNRRRWMTRVAVALALLGTAAAAGACDFTWDEKWKIWRGNCSLTSASGLKVEKTVVVSHPTLKMPDLHLDRVSFFLNGNSLELTAYIENIGTLTSGATTVFFDVTLTDPGNPLSSTTVSVGPAGVPSLPVNARQGLFVGAFSVDNSQHDVDVTAVGMVDPPTVAQPVRGTLYESDESNNDIVFMCRVFGPFPAAGVPGC